MESIIGHERVKAALKGGLPQTLLLEGPSGVGKRALALVVARAESPAWNILVVDGQVGVDRVREVLEFAKRRPLGRGGKVLILDVDGVTGAAMNALLKVLEEPPAFLKIVLVSSGGNVPLTVRSRCQALQCEYLSDDQVVEVLRRQGVEPEVARRAARAGNGSVEEARRALEQVELQAQVVAVGQALLNCDFEAAIKGSRKWTDPHVRLLRDYLEAWVAVRMGLPARRFETGDFPAGAKLTVEQAMRLIGLLDEGRMRPSLRVMYLAAVVA